MIKRLAVVVCISVPIVFAATVQTAQRAPAQRTTTSSATSQLMTAEAQSALVQQYCLGCHNANTKSGGLVLAGFDFAHVDQHAETAEKVIRKLRAGMMPPPGTKRPDTATVTSFVTALETTIDRAA